MPLFPVNRRMCRADVAPVWKLAVALLYRRFPSVSKPAKRARCPQVQGSLGVRGQPCTPLLCFAPGLFPIFLCGMPLPYRIATLLYCFSERDEVLLLERAQEPNRGLWSPCGGKLHTDEGESPYACAVREAHEELGLSISASDLHLAGLISEHGYAGQAHWLMFLFEVRRRLRSLPNAHREGRFAFFSRQELADLPLPQTDREQIWPWFWHYRGGFFAAHCHCHPNGQNQWTLEEILPPAATVSIPSPHE